MSGYRLKACLTASFPGCPNCSPAADKQTLTMPASFDLLTKSSSSSFSFIFSYLTTT